MNHKQICDKYGLPPEFLRDCERRGIIGKEVLPHQEAAFAALGRAWCNPKLVRMQYWALTPTQRKKVTEEEPMTKIERAIYNRYMRLRPGEKITVEQIATELCHAMHVRMSKSLFDKITRIKAKAIARRKYRRRTEARSENDDY